MNKLKAFYDKCKQIKHFHIYLAVAIGLVICIFYFAVNFKKPSTQSEQNAITSTEDYTSAVEYVNDLENKLESVLAKISGVGSVSVLICLEGGFSYEYATDKETKTSIVGGQEITVTSEKVLTVGDKPVVEKKIYPEIKGVVVVAKGSENFSVKMKILEAAETILQIESENITILS